MKTEILTKFTMLLAFYLLVTKVLAQPQMSNWYISPKKYNVSAGNGNAAVTTMSGAWASAQQVANSIYDNNGNLVFYIADNNIYNSTNTSIGGLVNYTRTMEITVVPFNCEGGKYHLFYMASGVPYDTYLYHSVVDMNTSTVTGGLIHTYSGGDVGGLAAGNLTTSGKRFVYAIYGYGFGGVGKIDRITINPDNSISTSTIITGNSTSGFGTGIDFATAEADLTHDGTKLAWAGMGNTANKAYIISLDANGNYVSGSLLQYTYGATGYIGRGVEFNADGTKLYAGGSNGIYQVTGTGASLTTPITGTASYGKSQLEMGINGFIYAVHSLQTYIIGINPSNNSLSSAVGITSPPYESVSGFLTLPDQIDGFNYTTQTNAFHAVNPVGTTTTWTPTSNPFGNVNPVRIQTSLTIPNGVNLRIDNMTIEFGLGATLNIQNGGTLRLYNTTLQAACPLSMWQGVIVTGTGYILMDDISGAGSKIYDAIKAIDATGTSAKVQVIDNSEFNRNEKHIVITNGNTNSNNIIRKSIFNHTTQLKDQARGLDQSGGTTGIRYGITSVELLNTTNTQTIGHLSSGQGNTFNEGQYGIYALNSNFNSYRNTFNTLRTRGIFADGQWQNRNANITTSNTFYGNKTAIDAHYGVNLTVQSNTFTNGTEHGILWFYNNGSDLIIGHRSNASLGNTFSYQNWSAIFANDNAHANTQITIGSNTIQNSSYIHGILVQETSLATNNTYQEMFINKNNISNIDYGIKIANVKGYDNQQNPSYTVEYVSNTLEIDSNTVTQFGIAKKGIWGENSPRIRTLENDVFTTNNFTWGNVGIEFSNGYKGAIVRNYCIAGAGIVSLSNMLDANIACNILESNIVGIDLNYEQLRLTSAQTHGTVGADNRYNSFLTIPTWGWDMRLYYSSQNQNKWVDPNTTNARIDYSSATLTYPPNSIIVTGGSYSPCYASIMGGGEQNGFSENEEFEYIEQIDDVSNRWLTEYMLQSENYETEQNFSQTENTFIPLLITFENYFSSGNFEAASEIFQQLNPENQFEANFKEVYEVALDYRTEEIRKLYNKEIERLVAVASQNPRDGGPAVYSARAILKFKENMDFVDKYEAPPYNISSESNKTDETNIITNLSDHLKVYPNPTDNELTIETPEKGFYLVAISNAFGQRVFSGNFNNVINKINTSELKSGIYLVEIINEGTNSSYFEKITIK